MIADAGILRAAGRKPEVPFSVCMTDGAEVSVTHLLRLLPQKRVVGSGLFNGQVVLVKVFIAAESERHWQREQQGIALLMEAGLPTPELLAAGKLRGGGHVLLSRFLPSAETLADLLQRTASSDEAVQLVAPALCLLARMHQVGLVHEDLHLGNFLQHQEMLYVIDGDAVSRPAKQGVLDSATARTNLALLLAQLPAEWDARVADLLAYYHSATVIRIDLAVLLQKIKQIRRARLHDFLRKSVRDCTLFAVKQDVRRFSTVLREHASSLSGLLADPEHFMAQGQLLKDGGTATVARVVLPEYGALVIKRYNLKNFRHALSRLWRPSRAWHSWREGLRLQFLGVATPQPLAMIEQRIGPLRQRAWLVTAHCPGPSLLEHLDATQPPPAAEAAAIQALFKILLRERISHGDLKATNLLWHDGHVVVIDLDAMRQHRLRQSHQRAWQRDRRRLLRNWPQDSALYQWLEANLPPV